MDERNFKLGRKRIVWVFAANTHAGILAGCGWQCSRLKR